MEFNATTGVLSGRPNDGNSSLISIAASNPAFNPGTQQSHQVIVFDPTTYASKLELSPKGVLSAETPNNIAGLVLRLDASTIDENNATVITSWMDSSGYGRNLDQYRGKPIVKFNQELDNQKVVYFDGYSQLYSTTDFYSLLDSYTIIGLVRHSGEHDHSHCFRGHRLGIWIGRE